MALDEVAAETAASEGLATVRVYSWEPSTLSLGYAQEPATIDWEFCADAGIDVTRRPTGGGAIYHDTHGDISYSIVVPDDAVPGDLLASYEQLCEPVFGAFERLGVDATFADAARPAIHEPACYLRALDPAHDVVGPDGRKLAGNAQYRRRDAVVQHGSLTFETTPARHCGCFTGDPGGATDGGEPTPDPLDPAVFRNNVAGIADYATVDRQEAVAAVTSALREWLPVDDPCCESWRAAELERAKSLASSRYADEAWIHDGEHQN
jgi:lipoate-protein ligase A